MKYVEFRFKNYKGIRDLKLKLDDRVTTLIGLNESGKTTILEAMFCFGYGAENMDALDERMKMLRDPERWIPIAERGNFNKNIEITADVVLDQSDQEKFAKHMKTTCGLRLSETPSSIEITEIYPFENSRYDPAKKKRTWKLPIAGTTGKQTSPRTYDSTTLEWKLAIAYLVKELPRIWYFANFLFELPEFFQLDEDETGMTPAEIEKQKFYRETFQKILSKASRDAVLSTHVVERLRAPTGNDTRNLNQILEDMNREMSRTIFTAWNEVFGREIKDQEVQISASMRGPKPIMELKIKGVDGIYDLSERSLGFRWFFMFLLMTRYLDSSGVSNDRVILLDEPASNLHSSAQAELLKSFEQLGDSTSIVYTTHSHHMINLKWLDNAYVIRNTALDNVGSSAYFNESAAKNASISATKYRKFVAENPSKTSYFQPVLDLLDYRPSLLEIVPNAVLVEGKSDFFILKYFQDVLGVSCNLALMPGVGAGAFDALIALHVGWGKSFLVLLDGDEQGVAEKARYEKEFEKSVEQRVVTLTEISGDSSIKEIEQILSEADKDLLITSVFGKLVGSGTPSRKKAIYQSVLELYGKKVVLTFEKSTIEKVEEIIRELERRLANQ